MSDVATDDEAIHARRWWTLGTLCLCLIVIGVDNTILNVALPSIARDLDASASGLQWVVDAYMLVFACLLLTSGSLGDRYGRRHALMFGLAWFAVFSALASTADSPTQLIVARGFMGIGGAFIYPTTLSILTNTFRDPGERARAIGVWAGVAGVGIALGPLAGGFLVEHFGWGSVFLVNVPICGLAFVLARVLVPNSSSREESPLDPMGAVFSIVGLVGFLYAVIQAPDKGWSAPVVVGGLAVGAVFLTSFAVWELRSPRAMLDVRFFKNPRFSAASATITLTFFALFGSTFLLTQYFQFVLRYSPLKAGLMLTPVAVGMMIGAPLAPHLVNRFGTKRVVVCGLVLVELVWNSARHPFEFALGGWVPGPRFLIPVLPFLCFALAPALRRAPATVGALAVVSAGAMVVATSAEPLLQNDDTHHWLSRIADGNFAATVVSLGGFGHGWLAILPFYLCVLVAAATAVLATRLPLVRRDLVLAAAAVAAWILVAHAAPHLLRVDRIVHESWGLAATILFVSAAAWAVVRLRPAGLFLLPFAAIGFDDHTKWALFLAVAVLAALTLGSRLRRHPGPA